MFYRKLYGEIAAICSEIYTKHKNALCGQKVVLCFDFKPAASKDLSNFLQTLLLCCEIAGSNLKFGLYVICGFYSSSSVFLIPLRR